ncbi:MAG: DNA polymerase I [Deltaproteobacteria bacterium]|nr:DNA polymerase I [Deltaproteobacteria bacterium]
MSAPPRLVLVDGTALIYRAFFAIPATFRTATGLPTNAIYGFALMFNKLFAGRKPDCGAVIFDAPGPTFRDEAYADYKADRAPMEDTLSVQLPYIDRLVEAQRFPTLSVRGYEADDVIGTLTRRGLDEGFEVLIVSSDKDFTQLIGPRVRMFDPMRDVTYDEVLVQKKWGVRPEQFVDLLALTGDSIDNIPGVPGIGQKGAAQLLKDRPTLKQLLDELEDLPPRYKKALGTYREQALLSQRLATIHTDVPLPLGPKDLAIELPDRAPLNAFYRELEFFSLLSEDEVVAAEAAQGQGPVPVLDEATAAAWLGEPGPLSVAPVFDGDAIFARPVGLALVRADGEAAYCDVQAGLPQDVLRRLADPEVPKHAHDAKQLHHVLRRAGAALAGVEGDTMLASFLVEPTKVIPHRLEQVAREYLQVALPPDKRLLGSGKSLRTFAELDIAAVAEHAAGRARAVHGLWVVLWPMVEAMGLARHYAEHERPLSFVLGRMEAAGIKVDQAELETIGAELARRLAEVEAKIHEEAGAPFNVGSTKQLGEVLFETLKLPVVKRTKTGYSTDAEVLERLRPKHPIAGLVLEHRAVSKLITTYTNVLAAAVRPETGRVHATFQQTTGASGRLISTDPDLQRTPIRTPEGKRIRRAFVAEPGHRIVSADWSQIELRLLAHASGDRALVAAFAAGEDVHTRTAAGLFGVEESAVDPEQRRVGKTVNFATIYGQGATALGQILGIPRAEAEAHIAAYFALYQGVAEWLERVKAEALEVGWVQTLFGRRRVIPELASHNPTDVQAGLRIAANTRIQGSAADLCKEAMLRIQDELDARGFSARMLLQIHDELVFEVPEAEVSEVCPLVQRHMEQVRPLAVPLVAEVGVGDSWGDAH